MSTKPQPAGADDGDSRADTRPYAVLLVDDSALVLSGLSYLISGEAPAMVVAGTARSAAEALEVAARCAPDVVVLDISLGRDDGLEVLPTLAARAPVVVLTWHDSLRTREGAYARGAAAFIHKTAPADQLLGAILDAARTGRAAAGE